MLGILVSASVQGGAFALIVWLAVKCLPTLSPTWKVWLWRLVFLKFALGLFGVGQIPLRVLPAPAIEQEPVAQSYQLVEDAQPVAAPMRSPMLPPDQPFDYAKLLTILWISGSALIACVVLYSTWRSLRLVKRASPVSDRSLLGDLRDLVRRARLRRGPQLLQSQETPTAMLAVGSAPAVILPCSLVEYGEARDIRLMIAHEVAHLAHRDLIWNGLVSAVQAVFFFHPLVWLSSRRIAVAQESAADQCALRLAEIGSKEYADMLFRASIKGSSRPAMAGHLALTGSYRAIKERLVAIEQFGRKPTFLSRILVVAAVGVVMLSLPGYKLEQKTPPKVNKTVHRPAHKRHARRRVAARRRNGTIYLVEVPAEQVIELEPETAVRTDTSDVVRIISRGDSVHWTASKPVIVKRGNRHMNYVTVKVPKHKGGDEPMIVTSQDLFKADAAKKGAARAGAKDAGSIQFYSSSGAVIKADSDKDAFRVETTTKEADSDQPAKKSKAEDTADPLKTKGDTLDLSVTASDKVADPAAKGAGDASTKSAQGQVFVLDSGDPKSADGKRVLKWDALDDASKIRFGTAQSGEDQILLDGKVLRLQRNMPKIRMKDQADVQKWVQQVKPYFKSEGRIQYEKDSDGQSFFKVPQTKDGHDFVLYGKGSPYRVLTAPESGYGHVYVLGGKGGYRLEAVPDGGSQDMRFYTAKPSGATEYRLRLVPEPHQGLVIYGVSRNRAAYSYVATRPAKKRISHHSSSKKNKTTKK